MNLLYAVSFLRPPPPEDLTVGQVSQPVYIFIIGGQCTFPLRLFACCLFFFGHRCGVGRLRVVNQMRGPENTRLTRANEQIKTGGEK
jgi:hypothetical protein